MNIVVCVKYVPDATGDRKFEEDNTVDRVGVDGLLSELDEYAVEQALQIREKAGDDTKVTALCVGPEKAVDAVRKALQMGADKGVHVLDDAIAGSDAIATSLVLAKAIEKIGPETPVDLVLCGMASTDAGMSVVPAMLAERLGLPQVTLASVVEIQGDQVRIKRDNEGSTEVIGATLPIVLSVTDQSGEARYPSFKGIMAAKKKPLETWSLSDLGIEAGQVGAVGRLVPGRRHHCPPAAHRRRDRHRRGRLGRHCAGRVPRVQEVHLRSDADMSEVLVVIDHVDGAVKKPTYELLTIARRLGEPSAVFFGSADKADAVAEKVKAVRRREGLRHRRCADQGLPRGPQGRGPAAARREGLARSDPVPLLLRGQGGRGSPRDQARLRPDHRRRRRPGGPGHHAERVRRQLHRPGEGHRGHADHHGQAQLCRS